MKKIKLFLGVALLGVMSFGVSYAYDYFTMSAEERTFLENVEALTSGEPGGGDSGAPFIRYLYTNMNEKCQYEYKGKVYNGDWYMCKKIDTWAFGVISNCKEVGSRSCSSKIDYSGI